MALGAALNLKSMPATKEPFVILPLVLLFWKTEIVLLPVFADMISGFPSLFRSAATTAIGTPLVAILTLEAKELAVMLPGVLVFLKSDSAFSPVFATTRSSFPSPSKSTTATP